MFISRTLKPSLKVQWFPFCLWHFSFSCCIISSLSIWNPSKGFALCNFADLCTFGYLPHRYNTFSGYPPEIVKKMPKKDLAEEVIITLFINFRQIPKFHLRQLLFPLFCIYDSQNGWLLCKTNHSPLSLIFLILVIFVLDCWPLYTPCLLGCPFLISVKLITY